LKEYKAPDKIVQKMTRDGLTQENKATGETERISARDKELSFTGEREADALKGSSRARKQKPASVPQQEQPAPDMAKPPDAATATAAMPQPGQVISGKLPLPLAPDGTPTKKDTGTAECVLDRIDTEHSRHVKKQQIRKANEKIRAQSSRLQFTDEERADPALSKHIRKSDKAADKLDAARAKIPKQKKPVIERTFDEQQGKSKVRLRFEETDKPVNGKMKHNPFDRPMREIGVAAHGEIHQVEKDNSGVEGAHKTEQLAERTAGRLQHGYRRRKLKPYRAAVKAEKTAAKANVNALYQRNLRENPQLAGANPLSKAWQKRKIRKDYAKAVRNGTVQGAQKAAATAKKTAQKATETVQKTAAFAVRHWKGILIVVAVILIFILLFAGLSSCGSMLQGGFTSIIGTSYTAEDEDITAVDADYTALEIGLRERINRVESDYPGYDEYRYFLDEIGHDPFELASYLTAKFNSYTPAQVQAELQAIFGQQYTLTITEEIEVRYRTETDTWTDEDGNTHTDTYTVAYNYYILNVTLKNKAISSVAAANLTPEQYEMYGIYMETKGNKPYLFEGNPYVNRGEYTDYDIPGDALTDAKFAAMIAEAEKYLGYPYVWGGSSPSTSFDCSGFVCWVINQSGVGSVGRTTATGLFNYCAAIPPSEAQPGDLIFFQGTYDSAGPVSHVGIYVGNGMMIHCGNPISYASVTTNYWTNHFYAYGRLP